jgi:hypothetical protein
MLIRVPEDNRSIYNKADAETRYEESDLSKEANKRNPPETRAEAKFSQMDPTKPVCSLFLDGVLDVC